MIARSLGRPPGTRILHRSRLRGGADVRGSRRGRPDLCGSARSAAADATTASSRAFARSPCPATGFSVGVSRLLAALRAIDSPIVRAAEAAGPVVVLALDRDEKAMASHAAPRRVTCARRASPRNSILGQGRHERPAQIRRQARKPLRTCPGLEPARRSGRPAGCDPRPEAWRGAGQEPARTAPTISNSASAAGSPSGRRTCRRCGRSLARE